MLAEEARLERNKRAAEKRAAEKRKRAEEEEDAFIQLAMETEARRSKKSALEGMCADSIEKLAEMQKGAAPPSYPPQRNNHGDCLCAECVGLALRGQECTEMWREAYAAHVASQAIC